MTCTVSKEQYIGLGLYTAQFIDFHTSISHPTLQDLWEGIAAIGVECLLEQPPMPVYSTESSQKAKNCDKWYQSACVISINYLLAFIEQIQLGFVSTSVELNETALNVHMAQSVADKQAQDPQPCY